MTTMSLSELTGHLDIYEQQPVAFARETRIGAWSALAALPVIALLYSIFGRLSLAGPRPGFFLLGWRQVRGLVTFGGAASEFATALWITSAVALAAAIYTHGFREASARVQVGVFVIIVAAVVALLPVLALTALTLFNLGVWIGIAILIAFVVGLVIGALGGGS